MAFSRSSENGQLGHDNILLTELTTIDNLSNVVRQSFSEGLNQQIDTIDANSVDGIDDYNREKVNMKTHFDVTFLIKMPIGSEVGKLQYIQICF